jgi:hypothetical protein
MDSETARVIDRFLESGEPLPEAGVALPNRPEGSSGWPSPMDPAAFHGLAGEAVRVIEPHTEADPAAVLVHLLAMFGSAVGKAPHFRVGADTHSANLFGVLVGETSRGRKGTSEGQARRLLREADPDWARDRIKSGLSSGEGLIWAVRDPIEKEQAVKEKGHVIGYEMVREDQGVSDKRLLVIEAEFASTLRVMGREGNTLSAVLRQAWDSGDLRVLTKNSPAVATGAHVSIVGHITKAELLRYMSATESGNGFGNRFLWICSKRSKFLPEGGSLREEDLAPLFRRLTSALDSARRVGEVHRDENARRIWYGVYEKLSSGRPGLLGSVTSRAEAQTMRLALVYALLDSSAVITASHLMAALAVWSYAEESARYVFGASLGDPVADTILHALKASADGLRRNDVVNLFQRHRDAQEIETALSLLKTTGSARCVEELTGGRPAERWIAN